jgi:hypothetical protein
VASAAGWVLDGVVCQDQEVESELVDVADSWSKGMRGLSRVKTGGQGMGMGTGTGTGTGQNRSRSRKDSLLVR